MTPGTRLGPYEIVATLGSGGMGAVYRARDSRLGRDVAIKVSAERFSDRFEREARAIAALNHPHICMLHDVGPDYLVMELVDGPTLADRIRSAPIPIDEALTLARQIADALQAAHDRGIVHRDLKPANIKITSDGRVKVLDFGLARLDDAIDSDPNSSPTQQPATRDGMVLGTAAYMAPEQARGQAVDKRADIWAFGVVLYEMLTGRRPFQGDTASDTIAALLTTEPHWTRVPPAAQPLLQRCLAKDPKRRLRDAGDIDLLLDAAPVTTTTGRSWVPWAVAAVLLGTLGPVAFRHYRERPSVGEAIRFQIPQTLTLAASGNIGLSPDGRHLAFLAAGDDGRIRVFVRVSENGGPITPVTALDPLKEENSHVLPTFLPDGRHFVYLRAARRSPDLSGTYIGSLDVTPEEQSTERLLPYATGMTYVPPVGGGPGRLLYVQEGNLIAQPFDAERRVIAGEGVTVAERVGVYLDGASFSASSNNILVYRTDDPEFPITWFDRQGNVAGRVSAPGRYSSVALSPLGTHAVAPLTSRRDSGNADLWLFDLVRGGNPTRFTYFPAMRADFPLSSFDGKQVLFRFPGAAGLRIFRLGPGGKMMSVAVALGPELRAQAPVALFQGPADVAFGDATADGQRFLLVERGSAPFTVALNWMRD